MVEAKEVGWGCLKRILDGVHLGAESNIVTFQRGGMTHVYKEFSIRKTANSNKIRAPCLGKLGDKTADPAVAVTG